MYYFLRVEKSEDGNDLDGYDLSVLPLGIDDQLYDDVATAFPDMLDEALLDGWEDDPQVPIVFLMRVHYIIDENTYEVDSNHYLVRVINEDIIEQLENPLPF